MNDIAKYKKLIEDFEDEDFEGNVQQKPCEQAANQLQEILDNMIEELYQVEQIFRKLPPNDRRIIDRAKSYWFAHIKMSLNNDHDYLGSGSVTMADTIEELHESAAEASAEDEDL